MDALDTYVRLLHPVMPFVTEAIWGAPPHRAEDPELLIVADWPVAGSATRGRGPGRGDPRAHPGDPQRPGRGACRAGRVAARGRVRARGVRARARAPRTGRSNALPGPVRDAPSHREALHSASRGTGGLAVIAGEAEAIVGRRAAGAAKPRPPSGHGWRRSWPSARAMLAAARARLENAEFTSKAPPAVVEGARTRGRSSATRSPASGPPRPLSARPAATGADATSPDARTRTRSGPAEERWGRPTGAPDRRSALDGAAGDAAHEVALEGEEHDQRQGHRDEGRRHEVLPVAAQ